MHYFYFCITLLRSLVRVDTFVNRCALAPYWSNFTLYLPICIPLLFREKISIFIIHIKTESKYSILTAIWITDIFSIFAAAEIKHPYPIS